MATRIVTINICDRCRKDLAQGMPLSEWTVRRARRGGKNYRIELCEECLLMFKSFLGEVEVHQLKDVKAPTKRKPRKAKVVPDQAAAVLEEAEADALAAVAAARKHNDDMASGTSDTKHSPFAVAS